jgi:hypothetical protein
LTAVAITQSLAAGAEPTTTLWFRTSDPTKLWKEVVLK